MSPYTVFVDPDPTVLTTAFGLARGEYQVGLLAGVEAWSGATLRGRARHWSSRYAASRKGLLGRLTKAGLAPTFKTVGRRKVLFVGVPRLADWERLVSETTEHTV